MGALSITGIKPGSTSLKLTAGKITKTVPITVLSRNLLSYGPAEGNGLTATVNTDGSLHVTGTASLFLNVISTEATPTAKDGDLRVQLESGDTAHDWMKPDNTSLKGGGYELANLYPRVTGLPKTLGTNPGVMVTEPSPGTYRFKGSTTQKVDSWDSLTCSVHVDAGTYTLDASDWPYDSSSWLIGIQSTLTPDDGSGQTIVFEPRGYGPRPLKAGTLRLHIFVNTTGEVDKTFTPRLYKID